MAENDTLALLKVPAFVPATVSVLFAILAQAMGGSYMALYAVERVQMSPLELSVFLTVSAITGIAISTLFGHWHDRWAPRWTLIVALCGSIVGYGLCAVTTNTLGLILIAAGPLGFGFASYPLLFAIAKGYLDRSDVRTATRGMAALRMISSLAWAIGPALGALFVGLWSYPGAFAGGAVLGLLALAIVLGTGLRALPPVAPAPVPILRQGPALWRLALPAAVALTLFNTAMFMGSNALSITAVQTFHGSITDVGLLFAICPAMEVVVMGAFVVWPMKSAPRWLMVGGFLVFAAYFLAIVLLPSLGTLYWSQALRAIAIGIVTVIGMLHIQQMMPERAGVASALFANTGSAAWLISGAATGAWAQAFGYQSLFTVCVALSVIGAVLFLVERRPAAVVAPEGRALSS